MVKYTYCLWECVKDFRVNWTGLTPANFWYKQGDLIPQSEYETLSITDRHYFKQYLAI